MLGGLEGGLGKIHIHKLFIHPRHLQAYDKYQKDFADQHEAPSITVPDPSSIRIPAPPPPPNQ